MSGNSGSIAASSTPRNSRRRRMDDGAGPSSSVGGDTNGNGDMRESSRNPFENPTRGRGQGRGRSLLNRGRPREHQNNISSSRSYLSPNITNGTSSKRKENVANRGTQNRSRRSGRGDNLNQGSGNTNGVSARNDVNRSLYGKQSNRGRGNTGRGGRGGLGGPSGGLSRGGHVYQVERRNNNGPAPEASTDVETFLQRAAATFKQSTSSIRLNNPRDLDLWMQAWSAGAIGALPNLTSALPQILLKLPKSRKFMPPTENVWRLLVRLAISLASERPLNIVKRMEVLVDLVEHRLLNSTTPNDPSCCVTLSTEFRKVAHGSLLCAMVHQQAIMRASALIVRLFPLLDNCDKHLLSASRKEDSVQVVSSADAAWAGWRSATVGWLLRADWVNAPQLSRTHPDAETYLNTLRQVMTMLAFYWGAGALFPRCRKTQGNSEMRCDQPLVVRVSDGTRATCTRSRGCSQPARWRCSRHGHDTACSGCVRRAQNKLIGETGSGASTDIYDATVERELNRREGTVYVLKNVRSRRPPTVDPNWSTTYRLKTCALLAIVRLAASREPLRQDAQIIWAEVVPINVGRDAGAKSEPAERARGRMAFRVLTRADLSTLQGEVDTLIVGSRIAVIDLQVFVPEVISVLSALTDDKLDSSLQHISFTPKLIGTATDDNDAHIVGDDENVAAVMRRTLENSDIDVVKRLNSHLREELISALTKMASQSNLRGTQLAAFSGALSRSCHCTQGPPGTGKSYLGVVLIRALDLIRTYAALDGTNLGPIVVLSYKNHALDEILLDVLKTNKNQNPRFLIRCGRSESEELSRYSERKTNEERNAESELTKRVQHLRAVKSTTRDIKSLRSAFEDESGVSLRSWTPTRKTDADNIDIVCEWIMRAIVLVDLCGRLEGEPLADLSYMLLGKLLPTSDDLNAADNQSVLQKLPLLSKDVEHWRSPENNDNRASFLLSNWLRGSFPPPRCIAWSEEDGCIMATETEGTYCLELHACLFPIKCHRRRDNGTMVCIQHRCTKESVKRGKRVTCDLPRMDENTDVCDRHACRICINTKRKPVLVRVGDACVEHSCRVDDCLSAALGPCLPFCLEHVCYQCANLTQTDPSFGLVRRSIDNSNFCENHKCQVKNCPHYRMLNVGEQLFCVQHACILCSGVRQLVVEDVPRGRLCDAHRCSLVALFDNTQYRCEVERDTNSSFCVDHTCRVCKNLGTHVIQPVVDDPPRNVCVNHPLCTKVFANGEQCNEPASSQESPFCVTHGKFQIRGSSSSKTIHEKVQCSGTTSKGKPCKSRGFPDRMPYYCKPHEIQRPESSEEDMDEENDFENMSETKDEVQPHEFENIPDSYDIKMKDVGDNIESCLTGEPKALKEVVENCSNANENAGELIENIEEVTNLKAEKNEFAVDTHEQESKNESSDTTEVDGPVDSFESCDEGNRERIAFGTAIDELYLTSEEEEEDESSQVPENLRQLFEIADVAVSSDSETVSCTDDESDSQGELDDSPDYIPETWSWEQSPPRRWHLASQFLHYVLGLVKKLSNRANDHVDSARLNVQETAAIAFKQARVVGATVVGATRRLHAIRSAEPFAMVVEEACEVMEPTLISVLAVHSLRKLELVGDNRQLPAFVQPCWFSITNSHPSIKVSLFERLVENGTAPLTVLDEQRRMRPEICDLTRPEYVDLVNITDHECTKSQRLADKAVNISPSNWGQAFYNQDIKTLRTRIESQRSLWVGNGNIPGTNANIFFWNTDSKETRAHVGLSRANITEAEKVTALAGWFIECGVPPSCITVLSPFKGQVLTIIRMFRKSKNDSLKRIFVSTVDRYQGDENDIIILSLTSTRPGNRFVALQNRFIVATSRARLGFFIIGSSGAVSKTQKGGKGPAHWVRLLSDLEMSPNDDSVSRFGKALPICCPRHPNSQKGAVTAEDFPSDHEEFTNFCSQQCTFKLPWCGHTCSRMCHNPSKIKHTESCAVVVERPCEHHKDVPLLCHEVQTANNLTLNLEEGLSKFKCNVSMTYRRPECSHSVDLLCFEYQSVTEGVSHLKDCNEPVDDYINPACGHRHSNCTCLRRRQWELEPPKCTRVVSHLRPCGCRARMLCHESVTESQLETPVLCREAVSFARPRCTHIISGRCFEAVGIQQLWEVQLGESASGNPLVIHYGVDYGASETDLWKSLGGMRRNIPVCSVKTKYLRSCGHETSGIPCQTAFEMAAGRVKEPRCMKDCSFDSPLCGHEIVSKCYMKHLVSDSPPSVFRSVSVENSYCKASEKAVLDCPVPSHNLSRLGLKCSKTVTISLSCGHDSRPIRCLSIASILTKKTFPLCKTVVPVTRKCGHVSNIVCHKRNEPLSECTEPAMEDFQYPRCPKQHTVRPESCAELYRLRNLEDPACEMKVTCERPRCGHLVTLPCKFERALTSPSPGECLMGSDVVDAGKDYRTEPQGAPSCLKPVTFRRECGHEQPEVPCHLAFKWLETQDIPPCQTEVQVVSPLCGHEVLVECHLADDIIETLIWSGEKPEKITCGLDNDVEQTQVVAVQNEHKIGEDALGILSHISCNRKSRIRRPCHHELEVPCDKLVDSLDAVCTREEVVKCDRCSFVRSALCHDIVSGAVPRCPNRLDRTCSNCHVNKVMVECGVEVINCDVQVRAPLKCGHMITWICGEDEDPRSIDDEPCLQCLHNSWLDVLQKFQKNEMEFNLNALLHGLRKRADGYMVGLDVKKRYEVAKVNVTGLQREYERLLRIHIELLDHAINNDERGVATSSDPLQLMDTEASFDIIYALDDDKKRLKARQTVYGYGITAKLFNEENILNEAKFCDNDGLVRLYVGAVPSVRGKDDLDPFREKLSGDLKEMKKMKQKAKKANTMKLVYRNAGYDYVVVRDDSGDRVYWAPEAVMTLLTVEIHLKYDCLICMDGYIRVDGFTCGKDDSHFLCRSCLKQHVKQAGAPGAMKRSVDDDGLVICPGAGCSAKYDTLTLVQQSKNPDTEEIRELLEMMERIRKERFAQREVKDAVEAEKLKLEAEFARIQAIQDDELRRASVFRLEVVNNVLTLQCPGCKLAFTDFDGCFALHCQYMNCNTTFCAWCLEKPNGDIYAHIGGCSESTAPGPSHTQATFRNHHKRRQKRRIIELLREKKDDMNVAKALEVLKKDLIDLGIDITVNDVLANGAGPSRRWLLF